MRQAAQVDAIGSKIHRAQLDMRFEEESFCSKRQLEQTAKGFIARFRFDAGTQNYHVGGQFELFIFRLSQYFNLQLIASFRDLGRFIFVEFDEHYTFSARLGVHPFAESVTADIAVENGNLGLWAALLDFESVFDGLLAANPRAVRMLLIARSNALNHYHRRGQPRK